jgi:hypothetical protein
MSALVKKHIAWSLEGTEFSSKHGLTRRDIASTYRVAEFVTLARDGSPVCWPLLPDFDQERLIFNTGYAYPAKARNAQREPRVAALFSDPTATGRSENDPLVLVQGIAEVFDQDLQRNTERYVEQLLRKGSPIRLILRVPLLRQLLVGYVARIWIEVIPKQEYVWSRVGTLPDLLHRASRPSAFSPGTAIDLPDDIFTWLPRYTRPPVLSYLDAAGWPAAIRAQATVRRDHIAIDSELEPGEGAPACLTYHRLIGNYRANDAFIIRGHFDAAGRLIPEKVVGYGGTQDDRGLGSLKLMRKLWDLRGQLATQLEREGRPLPVVRPSPRG